MLSFPVIPSRKSEMVWVCVSTVNHISEKINKAYSIKNFTRGPSSGSHSARWSLYSSRRWSLPSRPHAPRPQCAVNWDRNLKPKLAVMLQCTSVTDRQTDGHWHRTQARVVYITSRAKTICVSRAKLMNEMTWRTGGRIRLDYTFLRCLFY